MRPQWAFSSEEEKEAWIIGRQERDRIKVEKAAVNPFTIKQRRRVVNRHNKCGTVLVASGAGRRSHLLSALRSSYAVTYCGLLATSLRTVNYTTNLCPACYNSHNKEGSELKEGKTFLNLGTRVKLSNFGTQQLEELRGIRKSLKGKCN